MPDALVAFDAPDVAFVWLTSPNVTLDGMTPLALIARSDIDAIKVRSALRKIGSGA
ncbi:MAG: antitoxin Xre/MbcA/ParS toxin-binding domain-containing protein [Candidatus Baltobacteraceae bacterium]